MSLLNKIWQKVKHKQEVEEQEEIIYKWEKVNFDDDIERSRYIMDFLEQMTTATNELNHVTRELQVVDTYLHDMDEIQRLPKEEAVKLKDLAKHIVSERKMTQKYENRKDKLKEDRYYQLEQQEKEIEAGLLKLEETEKQKDFILADMKRLERESHSYHYRKSELYAMQDNIKGILIISIVAVFICSIILWILQVGFSMSTQLGFLILLFVFAIVLTIIYMKNSSMDRELNRLNKEVNQLIHLQNTVKIRYVNNSNLLEYLYMKYKVDSAKKLKGLWKCYLKEKSEHKKMADREANLAFYEKQLLQSLVRLRIRIPEHWLLNTVAIVESSEMKQIKDEMMERRIALRKQIDYNQDIGNLAKKEILEVAQAYPKYASELHNMVEDYEKKSQE